MVEEELKSLYKKTKDKLASLLNDFTYANFYRALQSGQRKYSFKNTQITKTIDEDWVNAIKACIPHLDSIVNNPRRFIKREQDVVPIEKARIIDADSVKHLASHTNLINSVDNGNVKPSKILTSFNDESFELYENRFIMTLIVRASQFIDRRYFLLGAGGNEFSSSVAINGAFEQAGENTEYSIKFDVKQGAEYFDGGIESTVYEDLFMIRKYMTSFKYSKFMKAMTGAAPVRPPIMRTNLLTKDPDYLACFELWNFISDYDKAGYKIEIADTSPEIDRSSIDEFDAVNLLQYLALKNKMTDWDDRTRPMKKTTKRIIKPVLEESNDTIDDKEYEFLSPNNIGLSLDGSNKKEVENVIKEALTRAVNKESVKQKVEDAERKRMEEHLNKILRETISHDKLAREQERRDRERMMAERVRTALAEERERQRQEEARLREKNREVGGILKRAVNRAERDDARMREQREREANEQNELIDAILKDALKIEEDRHYIKENPVVMFGHERMPVPLIDNTLPRPMSEYEEYGKMFAPPPPTDEELLIEAFNEIVKETKRGKYSAEEVDAAIKKALRYEEAIERKLAVEAASKAFDGIFADDIARERILEQEKAALKAAEEVSAAQEEKEQARAGNGSNSDLDYDAETDEHFNKNFDESLDTNKASDMADTSLRTTRGKDTDDETRHGFGRGGKAENDDMDFGGNGGGEEQEVRLSLWQRFLNFILFWRRRK